MLRRKIGFAKQMQTKRHSQQGLRQSAIAIEEYCAKVGMRMEKIKSERGKVKFTGRSRINEDGIFSALEFNVVSDGQDVYGSSSCPFVVPAKRRPAVSELLTRINWHLKHGRFDQNAKNGSVRFRCSIPVAVVLQMDNNKSGDLSRVVELPAAMMKDWMGSIRVVSKGRSAESVFNSEIKKHI